MVKAAPSWFASIHRSVHRFDRPPDARRTGAETLQLKLIPHEGMLAGRILTTNSKTVMLPYVVSLKRVPA